MSTTSPNPRTTERQTRIATALSAILDEERWTIRKLEARTGIGRNALAARLNGTVGLALGDVEIFADVLKCNPDDLYSNLRRIGDGEDINLRTLVP